MTKRFQIILTVSAAVLFILAFLLDISFFDQDWTYVLKNIDAIKIAIILTIITAVGFFFGLFFFRKEQYRQRLFWTLPIAFILFSLAGITKFSMGYYGLDEEYNYFTAKQDIESGKIPIFETGLFMPHPNTDWDKQRAAQTIVEHHFGYKSVYLGCMLTNGIAMYNDVMENYLDKVTGKGWRAKEQKMRDSIINSYILK